MQAGSLGWLRHFVTFSIRAIAARKKWRQPGD
jgi:hypothetical protein